MAGARTRLGFAASWLSPWRSLARAAAANRLAGREYLVSWSLDAVVVLTLGVMLRLPFASQTLWDAPAARLARSLRDPALIVSAPPGVDGVVRFVYAISGDPQVALVTVNVGAGALAAVTAYLAARALAGLWAARLAVGLVLASPLLWHASETGTTSAFVAVASGCVGLMLLLASAQRTPWIAGMMLVLSAVALTVVPLGRGFARANPAEALASLAWLAPFAVAGLYAYAREARLAHWREPLAIWLLLALGYTALRHDATAVLSLVVPASTLGAVGASWLGGVLPRPALRPLAAGAALAVLVSGLAFAMGTGRYSAAAITRHDDAVRARIAFVRAHFAPGDAILLAQAAYQQARYYLPDYEVARFAATGPRAVARLRDQIGRYRIAVWVDASWRSVSVLSERVAATSGVEVRVAGANAVALALGPEVAAVAYPGDEDPDEGWNGG